MDLKQLDAVIFDLDGVLIDSMPFHAQAWERTFQGAGLMITPEEVYAREGENGAAAVAFFLRQRNLDPTPELVARLLNQKNEIFTQIADYHFFDGAQKFLDDLRGLGKRLALVTGTSRHELHNILPPEFFSKFETVVSGDDVQKGKPNPEPYLKALAFLQLRPEQALVVENAPFGIQSARAAGLRCLAVETSLACAYLTGAEKCFGTIKELAAFLLGNDDPI
jgi:HAD superfamily hydrolase (TIGR01509 family)